MPKFTFEITPKQRQVIDSLPNVNWSEVLRQCIEREATRQDLARRIEEELNDADVQWAADLVNEALRKRWKREFGDKVRR